MFIILLHIDNKFQEHIQFNGITKERAVLIANQIKVLKSFHKKNLIKMTNKDNNYYFSLHFCTVYVFLYCKMYKTSFWFD